MFNINIYSNYKITKDVDSLYKSYDSDDPDWFMEDTVSMELTLSGGELIDNICKLLKDPDFMEVDYTVLSANSMELTINHFNPNDGTGAEYKYSIECIADYDKDQLFI